jgi:hypothetical protein
LTVLFREFAFAAKSRCGCTVDAGSLRGDVRFEEKRAKAKKGG